MRFGKELDEIEKVKSEKDLSLFIAKYLKVLLLHSYHNVDYYRHILGEADIVRNGKVHLDNFRQIPILTRANLECKLRIYFTIKGLFVEFLILAIRGVYVENLLNMKI